MEIDFATGFVWFSAFLFSTTVHEAMHAFAAWRLGDPTAYHGGQVSLSPAPHVQREPIGMLVLPLLTSLTQGWASGGPAAPTIRTGLRDTLGGRQSWPQPARSEISSLPLQRSW